MAEIKFITKSPKETIKVGESISKKLKKGSIIAFFGDLGAGKTTIIKGIVSNFSSKSKDLVNSPTFVYLNIYDLKLPIYHFDLYRIKNKNHFYAMGFEEYFNQDGICLIEWAENIKDILPQNTIFLEMKYLTSLKREIIVSNL